MATPLGAFQPLQLGLPGLTSVRRGHSPRESLAPCLCLSRSLQVYLSLHLYRRLTIAQGQCKKKGGDTGRHRL